MGSASSEGRSLNSLFCNKHGRDVLQEEEEDEVDQGMQPTTHLVHQNPRNPLRTTSESELVDKLAGDVQETPKKYLSRTKGPQAERTRRPSVVDFSDMIGDQNQTKLSPKKKTATKAPADRSKAATQNTNKKPPTRGSQKG